MSVLCTIGEQHILNWFAGRTSAHGATWTPVRLALHTADPGEGGTVSEVSGGSYARQDATFSWDATNNRVRLSAAVTFAGMPATTVRWVTLRTNVPDSQQPFARFALTSPITVAAGNSLVLEIDSLRLWVDTAYRHTVWSRQHFPRLLVGDYSTLPGILYLQAHNGDPGASGTANVITSSWTDPFGNTLSGRWTTPFGTMFSVVEESPSEFVARLFGQSDLYADPWEEAVDGATWFSVWDASSGGNCLWRQPWIPDVPHFPWRHAENFSLFCERTGRLSDSVVFASSAEASLVTLVAGASATASFSFSATMSSSYLVSAEATALFTATASATSASSISAAVSFAFYAGYGQTRRASVKTAMRAKTTIKTGATF